MSSILFGNTMSLITAATPSTGYLVAYDVDNILKQNMFIIMVNIIIIFTPFKSPRRFIVFIAWIFEKTFLSRFLFSYDFFALKFCFSFNRSDTSNDLLLLRNSMHRVLHRKEHRKLILKPYMKYLTGRARQGLGAVSLCSLSQLLTVLKAQYERVLKFNRREISVTVHIS